MSPNPLELCNTNTQNTGTLHISKTLSPNLWSLQSCCQDLAPPTTPPTAPPTSPGLVLHCRICDFDPERRKQVCRHSPSTGIRARTPHLKETRGRSPAHRCIDTPINHTGLSSVPFPFHLLSLALGIGSCFSSQSDLLHLVIRCHGGGGA